MVFSDAIGTLNDASDAAFHLSPKHLQVPRVCIIPSLLVFQVTYEGNSSPLHPLIFTETKTIQRFQELVLGGEFVI